MSISLFQIAIACGIFISNPSYAARILMIQPLESKSHDNFHSSIARSLLAVGHHVTSVTWYPKTISHDNCTIISLRDDADSTEFTNTMPISEALQMSKSFDSLFSFMVDASEQECRKIIRLNEIQKILKSEEKLFDVLMIDMVPPMSECFLPIAEKFDTPVVGIIVMKSWRYLDWMMGNPSNPTVDLMATSSYVAPMTFAQRLDNSWNFLKDILRYEYIVRPMLEKFYQQYFPHYWKKASRKKPSILFVNNHLVLTPRPLLPSIIYVGGLHIQPEKLLPKTLRSFIDEAKHGVVLFSIGSFIKSGGMPPKMLSILREVFTEIPQRVIWKAEEKIESLSENVLVSKWLPQRDILAHKNVVAFISHCGVAGMYEAIHGGVPMVLFPIFADQIANAVLLQKLGVGVYVDVNTLTKKKLSNALEDVINTTRYRERMNKFSSLIKDQPISLQESVTYWTDYVIRHTGAQHLQSVASKMPLYQYLLLDVVGFICLLIFAISVVFYVVVKKLCKIIGKRSDLAVKKKKSD